MCLNFDELLHPAQAFDHPSEVVNDPDLTLNEKRAILASWASDACAVEAAPALRIGRKAPVGFDDIMEALRSLDKQANGLKYRHAFRMRSKYWRARPMKVTTKAGRFSRKAAVKTNPFVIARERNVVRVDFRREPDPPAPKFPGASALRNRQQHLHSLDVFHQPTLIKAEVA